MPILSESILDERQGPETTPSDAAEIAAGREAEDVELDFAAEGLLDRLRGEVRKQARDDVDDRLAELPTAPVTQDWKPFAWGIGVGAGLVVFAQLAGAVLVHLAR